MGSNIKDVALRAGVSPSTVSRVLAKNPRISKETSDRVREVMRDLNYHPNAVARSLVKQSSQTLGILIPNTIEQFLQNPFFPEVLRGIAQSAQTAGYDIFLSTALHGLDDGQRLAQMARSKRVDGVILLTARVHDPLLDIALDNGIPTVVIGRPDAEGTVSWVNNDNKKAAYDVTAHLLDLGHRRIGFIGGAQDLIVTLDRLAGYSQALEERGIVVDPYLLYSGEFHEEAGCQGMVRLLALADRPSAVVASDDVLAFGAMRAAGELGYRIPEDMAVTGFNDIPLAKLANPPLTSMNVNVFELGQTAARLLLEQLARPQLEVRGITVEHELVVRRSCGAWAPFGPDSGWV
ncbi:MAG: LacI family DNA-binding transcriptional regulator [Firmicutes bacterium]|nr:LacI family DNA-binding transcriptional regulator [Bacillota bacterium]